MALYSTCWKSPFAWPAELSPATLVSLTEAANLLGVDRRTLQRAIKRGDGPQPEGPDVYVGRATWFRVTSVLLWRAQVTGDGPRTEAEVWEHWLNSMPFTWIPPRPNPQPRPSWWKRGARRTKVVRSAMASFRARVCLLEGAYRLLEGSGPLSANAAEKLLAESRRFGHERDVCVVC